MTEYISRYHCGTAVIVSSCLFFGLVLTMSYPFGSLPPSRSFTETEPEDYECTPVRFGNVSNICNW